MSAENLLAEFPPVSTAEWEAAIDADLKGASYEEMLIWHAPEGIAIRPCYRAEDLRGRMGRVSPGPAQFPAHFLLSASTPKQVGVSAKRSPQPNQPPPIAQPWLRLLQGAEEIAFPAIPITNNSDLALLLANLDEVPVHFAGVDEKTLRLLLEFFPPAVRTRRRFQQHSILLQTWPLPRRSSLTCRLTSCPSP